MIDRLARALIGPAAEVAHDLEADAALVALPGRIRGPAGLERVKVRPFNTKAGFVEPFFNHDDGDTRCRKAA